MYKLNPNLCASQQKPYFGFGAFRESFVLKAEIFSPECRRCIETSQLCIETIASVVSMHHLHSEEKISALRTENFQSKIYHPEQNSQIFHSIIKSKLPLSMLTTSKFPLKTGNFQNIIFVYRERWSMKLEGILQLDPISLSGLHKMVIFVQLSG